MSIDIRQFQKQYALSNRDMAEICQCSLPTIQKWRSGEVSPSGSAQQLMKLLHHSGKGNPARLRELLAVTNQSITPGSQQPDEELQQLETSMTKVMNRLELMLEARRKERELQESEARYRSMVESTDDPVCRWKPDTTLTFVNKAYARLYSKHGTDLIGKKWMDFIPPARRAFVETLVSETVRGGEPQVMTHESVDKDGRIHFQEWRDSPIKNERGRVVEFHSVGHDVTELMQLQKQLNRYRALFDGLMSSCRFPVVVFDATGRFTQMNERFRALLSGNKRILRLGDLFSDLKKNRFNRLLQRLSDSDHILYQFESGTGHTVLRAQALMTEPGEERYLGIIEDGEPAGATEVTRVRLGREAVIGEGIQSAFLDEAARKVIFEKMAQTGRKARVDRVHVFTFDDKKELLDNVLEWVGEGVQPHINELQRIPFSSLRWWVTRLKKGQWINIEETADMPRTARNEQQILQAQGICSILVAPLEADGRVLGFVGFDQNGQSRLWHSQELEALRQLKEHVESTMGGPTAADA